MEGEALAADRSPKILFQGADHEDRERSVHPLRIASERGCGALKEPDFVQARVSGQRVHETYFGGRAVPTTDFTQENKGPPDRQRLFAALAKVDPSVADFWSAFVRIFFLGMQSVCFFSEGMTIDSFLFGKLFWRQLGGKNHWFKVVKDPRRYAQYEFRRTEIFSQKLNQQGNARKWVCGFMMQEMFELERFGEIAPKFKSFSERTRIGWANELDLLNVLGRCLMNE
ncbi:hypothetical protein FVE85_7704 [Porphyridium purpureum]|uniref:Uncharacterized protein n=1 Tax=Porphyridium purpureum TaxID=35688 RepID=A0A5J4YKY9_PORPP|nr:hypothetical protein FVE85_3852 [Porphyridium purpureum]KAA8491283.1 hypothetical protein FVE85_7704 [Porphyridium purpureum]|eukprot:POR9746..scf210_14